MSRAALTYYIEDKLRLMPDDDFFEAVSNIFKCAEDMREGAMICPYADKCHASDVNWKSCADFIRRESTKDEL